MLHLLALEQKRTSKKAHQINPATFSAVCMAQAATAQFGTTRAATAITSVASMAYSAAARVADTLSHS